MKRYINDEKRRDQLVRIRERQLNQDNVPKIIKNIDDACDLIVCGKVTYEDIQDVDRGIILDFLDTIHKEIGGRRKTKELYDLINDKKYNDAKTELHKLEKAGGISERYLVSARMILHRLKYLSTKEISWALEIDYDKVYEDTLKLIFELGIIPAHLTTDVDIIKYVNEQDSLKHYQRDKNYQLYERHFSLTGYYSVDDPSDDKIEGFYLSNELAMVLCGRYGINGIKDMIEYNNQ